MKNGFTLLEVIIALVLISTVGISLFAWLNNLTTTASRLKETLITQEAITNALEFSETINPLISPTGEKTIGKYTFTWTTDKISETAGVNNMGGVSLYQIGLYNLVLNVKLENYPNLDIKFNVKKFSFRQTQEYNDGIS